MPKTLTIVNSVYHLLTALNLRRLSPAGEGADLLVTDATPGLPELIPRLRETGLFSRVLPVRAGELAQHYPMDREEAVAQCFSQGEALLRWALGEALEPAYSQVYFPNFDWLARLLACRYQWGSRSRRRCFTSPLWPCGGTASPTGLCPSSPPGTGSCWPC